MANLITGSRIFLSVLMLFFPARSGLFYVCYLLAGFTDMIDGTVARMREETSEFGSRIDSIADIVFVAASVYKLLPLSAAVVDIRFSLIVVCIVATFAAIQEGHIIRTGQ